MFNSINRNFNFFIGIFISNSNNFYFGFSHICSIKIEMTIWESYIFKFHINTL